MQRKERRMLRYISIITLAIVLLFTGRHTYAEGIEKDVKLTIYDYDWTAYSEDNVGAQKTQGTGEVEPSWDSGRKKYALKDIEFTLIKVADLGGYENAGEEGTSSIGVTYELEEEIRNLLLPGSTKDRFSAEELSTALENHLQAAENYANREDVKKYGVYTTDEEGKIEVTIPAADNGVYLVVETKVSENVNKTAPPFLITLPMAKASGSGWNYDVHAYPKNETKVPTVKKLVKDENDSSFNDSTSITPGNKVEYNLVAAIPEVNSEATYFAKFEFEDNISKGIECETTTDANGKVVLKHPEEVSVRIYTNRNDAFQQTEKNYISLKYGEDYILEYDKNDNSSSKLRVILTKSGLKKLNSSANGNTYLSVRYPTIVGSVSDLIVGENGNRADVTLYYGRTATTDGEGTTIVDQAIEDAAIVLLYGFEIQKKFDVPITSQDLIKNVQFLVKNTDNNKYLQGEVTEGNEDGSYSITNSTDDKSEATIFIPSMKDGVLIIDGVQDGNYEITEIKTISGYVLLKDPIKINIVSKEFKTEPTTAVHAGQQQQVSEIGVSSVHGKEQATATVNGEEAEVTEEGRIPRVRMTLINKKEKAANKIEKIPDKTSETVEETIEKIKDVPKKIKKTKKKIKEVPKKIKKVPQNIKKTVRSVLHPKTGDNTNILRSILMMLISGGIIIFLWKKRKA